MGVIEYRRRIPSLVIRRKKRWLELHDVESPVFIGTIPERRVDDPVFVKIWGFTDEVIRGRTKPPEGDAGEG